MRSLFIIGVNFLKLTFNKKRSYLFYFLLPVLSLILMLVLFGITESRGFTIGYVNKDSGSMGADLISYLGQNKKNDLIAFSEDQLRDKNEKGDISISFIIPEDFSSRILNGLDPVIVLSSPSDIGQFFQADLNSFINKVVGLGKMASLDETLFKKLYGEFLKSPYSLTISEVADSGASKNAGSIGIGYLLFIIMFQSSFITGLMLKEKENRTFFRIRTTPVREIYYTLGNMLAAFLILGAQIILTLFVVSFLFKMNLALPVIKLLPLLLAFVVASIGFGIMITAFAGSTMQGALIANLIITPSCMLGGCFWPLDLMPKLLTQIAVIFPQTWIMKGVSRLQDGGDFSGFTVLLVLAFGGLFVTIYAYKMRHDENLSNFV